ncbi:hypothetical protein EV44_g4144 [Erysiphe necator]|uniref:Retrotransposon gag domain-containing protein n=1 Tax=Uncinula necator TaxID=52586 RepID=A0A0B1NZR8_UNCNE|nr:hypothetical protein EV44_g4144 [Erysiphe necator]
MTEKSRIRMPKLNLSLFDGDGQSADRWLALLKQDFSAENVYKETHPQLWLEAIYSKVSGKAEDWMDQTLQVRKIMENRETATILEVEAFEIEFKSRFPGRTAARPQSSPFLYAQSLKQEPHENLVSYIARVRDLWNLAGGRNPTRMEPMYDMGCQVIVQGFVSGLFEEVVKFKAIENGAMGVTDLEEAISKVNAAVQTFGRDEPAASRILTSVFN